MKFDKFYAKAKDARDRLRPGEVKRYDISSWGISNLCGSMITNHTNKDNIK